MYNNDAAKAKINQYRTRLNLRTDENTNNWDLVPEVTLRNADISLCSFTSGQPLRMGMQTNALLFVKEGNMILGIDQNYYIVSAGQLVLLPTGAQIILLVPNVSESTVYKIDFTLDSLGDFCVRFGLHEDNHVISLSAPEVFSSLCDEILENTDMSDKVFSVFRAATVIQMIALYVNQRLDIQSVSSQFSPVIQHMQEYLGAGELPAIPDLAELVHMSPEHFIRKFHSIFACTPIKFFNQLRIKKALYLLLFTDKSIHEIGAEIGMFDSSHFTRFFSKNCGLSPSKCRTEFPVETKENADTASLKDTESDFSVFISPGVVLLQHAVSFWLEDKIRDSYRFFCPVDGALAYLTEKDKLYIARKNQLALLPANQRARYTLTKAQDFSYYHLFFKISINGENAFSYLGLTEEPLVVDLPRPALVDETCFLAMRNDMLHSDIAYHLFRSGCMIKVTALYADAREKAKPSSPDPLLEKACQYMKEHLNGSASISEFAEQNNMRPSHFINKFKKVFGCTPKKYYNALRAEAAADMLLHTSLYPLEIGKKIGFTTPKYFDSFFTEYIGVSPEEYRELYAILKRTERRTEA